MIEELFYPDENVYPTSSQKIKRARGQAQNWAELQSHLDDLRGTLYMDGPAPIRAKIREIVPEYSYPEDIASRVSDAPAQSVAGAGRR